MQSRAGCLAGDIQSGNVGPAIEVADDPAASVVRSRHDRNRLAGDVDAEFQAARVNIREVLANERFALVRNIEEYAVQTAFLHFKIDGAGHDVTGCQFGALVVFGHETGAVGQAE